MNYNSKTIIEISQALHHRQITGQELVVSALTKIAQNQNLNATTDIRLKAAKKLAVKQDAQRDRGSNPLWGIPFAAKDNFSVAGEVTTASTLILKNYVAPNNAFVIDCLTAVGANLICKTTMDELGMGGHGLYAATGWVRNPYDHDRISGGSSSGSAVLVAIGAVSFALGTDTGDSIRKPAAYCGLVGLKPTYGLISRSGVIPFAPSLDTVGILCRSVTDCGLILDVLARPDQQDFSNYRLTKYPSYRVLVKTSATIKKLKVVYFSNVISGLDRELQTQYNKLFAFLQQQKIQLTSCVFPPELLHALAMVYKIISSSEASTTHANLDGVNFGVRTAATNPEQVVVRSRSANFGGEIKKRLVFGSFCLKKENQKLIFHKAQKIRTLLSNFMRQIWQTNDILILPGSSDVAPLVRDILDRKQLNSVSLSDDLLVIANLVGFPSLTIPFLLRNQLPIGINLNADCFQEKKLMQFAQFIEKYTQLINLQVEK